MFDVLPYTLLENVGNELGETALPDMRSVHIG